MMNANSASHAMFCSEHGGTNFVQLMIANIASHAMRCSEYGATKAILPHDLGEYISVQSLSSVSSASLAMTSMMVERSKP